MPSSTNRSNGSKCLFNNIASITIFCLHAGGESCHKLWYNRTSNCNWRYAWEHNKGQEPSSHKCNNEATNESRKELYGLSNLNRTCAETLQRIKNEALPIFYQMLTHKTSTFFFCKNTNYNTSKRCIASSCHQYCLSETSLHFGFGNSIKLLFENITIKWIFTIK